MLIEYDRHRLCRIYAADTENGALLIERLSPGKNLFYDTEREQRLGAFAGLYNGLHIKPRNTTAYPAYKEWTARVIALSIRKALWETPFLTARVS